MERSIYAADFGKYMSRLRTVKVTQEIQRTINLRVFYICCSNEKWVLSFAYFTVTCGTGDCRYDSLRCDKMVQSGVVKTRSLRCRCKAIKFLQNYHKKVWTHKRHPIARPFKLWFILCLTSVVDVMYETSWYIVPRYNGIRQYHDNLKFLWLLSIEQCPASPSPSPTQRPDPIVHCSNIIDIYSYLTPRLCYTRHVLW